jgi:hypothetical protein
MQTLPTREGTFFSVKVGLGGKNCVMIPPMIACLEDGWGNVRLEIEMLRRVNALLDLGSLSIKNSGHARSYKETRGRMITNSMKLIGRECLWIFVDHDTLRVTPVRVHFMRENKARVHFSPLDYSSK